MNPLQQRLLDIARLNDIESIRRIDLVALVGCEYPSQITHHLNQLIKRGDLIRKRGKLVPAMSRTAGLLRIPVLGEADCGEATKFADGSVEGYLTVSPSIIRANNFNRIYALIARGDSMNKMRIKGKLIENNDYVIVEKSDAYQPLNNEVVVSNIAGLANIKCFKRDHNNNRIILFSQSTKQENYPPIIISELDDYNIMGKVVDVIKAIA